MQGIAFRKAPTGFSWSSGASSRRSLRFLLTGDTSVAIHTITIRLVTSGTSVRSGNGQNRSNWRFEGGDRHAAYTSGVIGHNGSGHISVAYLLIGPYGRELLRECDDTSYWGSLHDAEYLEVQRLTEALTKVCLIEDLSLLWSSRFVVNQLRCAWRINVDRHQCFVITIKSTLRAINWSVTWIPGRNNAVKSWQWENYNAKHSEVNAWQEH
jgi:hypothetical protein